MDDERKKLVFILGMGTQFGFMVAATMAGLLIGGVYLDKILDTKPTFTILGVVAGLIGAGAEIRYVVLPFLEKRSNNNEKQNKEKKVNNEGNNK